MEQSRPLPLTSPVAVKALCAALDLHPSRVLGQNFLIDRNILDILIAAAAVQAEDHVLEVGPGLGVVTAELAARARHVTCIEKDRRLAAHLRGVYADATGVTVIEGDALEADLEGALVAPPAGPIAALVSNLPYAAGSRILVNVARLAQPPARVCVTVQLEVAERLTAAPDSADYGLLTVETGLVYRCSRVKVVSERCFWPAPAVRSAIVLMERRDAADWCLAPAVRTGFHALLRAGFGHRRKQLGAALTREAAALGLPRAAIETLPARAGLDSRLRPEQVDVAGWIRLAAARADML